MKLTADDFLNAYRKHGLKPIKGVFNVAIVDNVISLGDHPKAAGACCPMTAFMLGKKCPEEFIGPDDDSGTDWSADILIQCFEAETGIDGNFWTAFDRAALELALYGELEPLFPFKITEMGQLARDTAELLHKEYGFTTTRVSVDLY